MSTDKDTILQDCSGYLPLYLSKDVGRDYGCPSGGWVPEIERATRMTEAEADRLLETSFVMTSTMLRKVRV